MLESPVNMDALDFAGLKALVLDLLEQGVARDAEIAALREENLRLKGLNGPPAIKPSGQAFGASLRGKPSGMDKKARSRAKVGRAVNQRGRGKKKGCLKIDEKRVVTVDVPQGSRFKGYEDYLIQDLICRPHTVLLRRERWLTPHGNCVVAPLPTGTRGHFGPELRRFIVAHYHGLQTSVERLVTLLGDLGVVISKRQIMRLLNDCQENFVAENNAVLHAGLECAPWISVDDTGARHQHRNGVTTQIGNDAFTWFATSFSRSRLNFLSLLRAGHKDYVLNEAAFSYMAKLRASFV